MNDRLVESDDRNFYSIWFQKCTAENLENFQIFLFLFFCVSWSPRRAVTLLQKFILFLKTLKMKRQCDPCISVPLLVHSSYAGKFLQLILENLEKI